MPDFNTTVRHARTAIGLLLSGCVREVEAAGHGTAHCGELADNLVDEILDWDLPMEVAKWVSLVDDIQAAVRDNALISPEVHTYLVDLLRAHELTK